MGTYLEEEVERMTRSKIEFFVSRGPARGWDSHLHTALEILYVIAGEYTFGVDDMTFRAHPGDLVLIRPNAIHEMDRYGKGSVRHYTLKLHPDVIFNALFDAPRSCSMRLFGRATMANTYFPAEKLPAAVGEQLAHMGELLGDDIVNWREMSKLAREDPLLFPTLRCEAVKLLLMLLYTVLPEGGEEGEGTQVDRQMMRRMFDGIAYIEENYMLPITPQECAAHLCMSYSHFAKQFRAVTGRTFKQYLTYVRISHAEADLLTTTDPVTEIALRAGFNNVSHFIATYRTLRGKTPLDTRRERGEGRLGGV